MYEWLRNFQRLSQDIAYLEYNLEQTERELKRWENSYDLGDIKLESESRGAKVEDIIEQIKNDLSHKKLQRAKLISLVESFKGLDIEILRMKYFHGMTLEEIAEGLNYSASHIRKKHAELMRTIKFVDELCIIPVHSQ